MKIIITTTEENINSQVDERFGRAPYFFVAEVEGEEIKNYEFISNIGQTASHGAGTGASQKVANLKAEVLITSKLGPKASDVLSQVDIKIYSFVGTIKEAIKALAENNLEEIKI